MRNDREPPRSPVTRLARGQAVQQAALCLIVAATWMLIAALCSLLVDGVTAKRAVWVTVLVLGSLGAGTSIALRTEPDHRDEGQP